MLFDPGLPIVGYRFVVVITAGLVPNPIDIQFQEVSGLSMKRSVNYEKGMMTLGGPLPTQNLTLKRGVFTGPSALVLGNIAESILWDTRMLRKDLMVTVLDKDNTPVCAWIITGAYMESWDWGNLDGKASDILLETMSFKYTNIKFVPLKMTKTG